MLVGVVGCPHFSRDESGRVGGSSRRYSKVESSHGKEIPSTKSATLTVRHERSIDIIHFMTRLL